MNFVRLTGKASAVSGKTNPRQKGSPRRGSAADFIFVLSHDSRGAFKDERAGRFRGGGRWFLHLSMDFNVDDFQRKLAAKADASRASAAAATAERVQSSPRTFAFTKDTTLPKESALGSMNGAASRPDLDELRKSAAASSKAAATAPEPAVIDISKKEVNALEVRRAPLQ